MSSARVIFLTGATGLLGRYLFRELLLAEYQVIVLVRNSADIRAIDRIRSILHFWNEELGVRLAEPQVLIGDLCLPDLGLTGSDRRWLSSTCNVVVHAAASLEFRKTAQNEPFRTNLEGTRRLLDFCQSAGIREFHHVSTAFVCGSNPDEPVREDAGPKARTFNNPYEQTKWAAECLVRDAAGLASTIYRPSIIVGDSKTGYTSTYHGIYRFAELGSRFAEKSQGKRRKLEMRLPMTGAEPRNLVPVDWVARALVRIIDQPTLHGRIYHLVSPDPVPVRSIKQAAEEVLGLDGIRWGGPEVLEKPSILERHFLDRLHQYMPYLQADPVFDASNLRSALPDLPAPTIDQNLLLRLFEFAVRNRWGHFDRVEQSSSSLESSVCRTYVEETFPKSARSSPLGRELKLEVLVGIEVQGPAGGQWTLEWEQGELVAVQRGLTRAVDVLYRMDFATFGNITQGRQSPAQAFFDQRFHLEGDIEKGLKLAVVFEELLQEPTGRMREKGILHESHE